MNTRLKFASIAAALALGIAAPVGAQVVMSHQDINREVGNEGKAYVGQSEAGEVTMTIVSKEQYRFSVPGSEDVIITYRMDRAGGRPDGNPVINGIDNGVEVRVEWLNRDNAKMQLWLEGGKAGQYSNNPPLMEVMLQAR